MSHGITATMGVPQARKRTYYLLDATSTWTSTTTHDLAVPTGVRWKVLVITVKNDASATTAIYYSDASKVVIAQLATQGANTGRTTWPDVGNAEFLQANLIMDPGEHIQVVCGAAQGAGAYIYIHVLEIPWA